MKFSGGSTRGPLGAEQQEALRTSPGACTTHLQTSGLQQPFSQRTYLGLHEVRHGKGNCSQFSYDLCTDCPQSCFSYSYCFFSSSLLCCAAPLGFLQRHISSPTNSKEKHRWEGLEEATEIESSARPHAHTFLRCTHIPLSRMTTSVESHHPQVPMETQDGPTLICDPRSPLLGLKPTILLSLCQMFLRNRYFHKYALNNTRTREK